MSTSPGPTSPGAAAKSPSPPDLSGIEQAITALTTFLRNGQATPDATAFDKDQLQLESDFRALLRGLGRAPKAARPGRFEWVALSRGHLELTEPLPASVTEIGGFTADRKAVWRVVIAATSKDRRVFTDHSIDPEHVVRLRAFDARSRRLLIGFPARTTTSPTPAVP